MPITVNTARLTNKTGARKALNDVRDIFSDIVVNVSPDTHIEFQDVSESSTGDTTYFVGNYKDTNGDFITDIPHSMLPKVSIRVPGHTGGGQAGQPRRNNNITIKIDMPVLYRDSAGEWAVRSIERAEFRRSISRDSSSDDAAGCTMASIGVLCSGVATHCLLEGRRVSNI